MLWKCCYLDLGRDVSSQSQQAETNIWWRRICALFFLHFIPIQHTYTAFSFNWLEKKKCLNKCVEPIDWNPNSDLKSDSKSLLAIMKFCKMQTEIKMNPNRLYSVRISFEKDLRKKNTARNMIGWSSRKQRSHWRWHNDLAKSTIFTYQTNLTLSIAMQSASSKHHCNKHLCRLVGCFIFFFLLFALHILIYYYYYYS